MSHFKIILIVLLSSNCLFSQTREMLYVKSFYYDVDNFSLTSESMNVLKSFVKEVKTKPIEMIEIVGYIEKNGADIYNEIKSKKRMISIRETIDSTIIIYQYRPENIDYPPAFLYSYTDGINWRRVDIKYRYKDRILLLPSKETEIEDPFNTKNIESDIKNVTKNIDILTKTNQVET